MQNEQLKEIGVGLGEAGWGWVGGWVGDDRSKTDAAEKCVQNTWLLGKLEICATQSYLNFALRSFEVAKDDHFNQKPVKFLGILVAIFLLFFRNDIRYR